MLISVRVIPRSSKNSIEWQAGERGAEGTLKVRLTAPPVDGAANEALIAFLAQRLALPKRHVTIVRGASGRQKVIEITDLTVEELHKRIASMA